MMDIFVQANIAFLCVWIFVYVWVAGDLRSIMEKEELYCSSFCSNQHRICILIGTICELCQDHNHDFIVVFPDWDPSTNSKTGVSNTQKKINLLPPGNRGYLFQETASDKPQAHLWYPTDDVIKALQLFLAGGKNLSRSLTYR